jgi:predicted CoA-binding protein
MDTSKRDSHSDQELMKIYDLRNIAVVGMSNKEGKPGYFVPKYLIEHGYNVIPVNPTLKEVLGKTSYPDIVSIPTEIDIIDIFRKSEDVPPVVEGALKKKGVKIIWMQEGIYNEDAEKLAKENGLDVLFNRCMMAEHMRLFK